jgi:osmoprotectant transport system substrate-binding protein
MKFLRTVALTGVALASVATLAACSSSKKSTAPASGGSSTSSSAAKGKVTLGAADFGESSIIANIYELELKKAGYTVSLKDKIGARDVYIKALESGEIDVVPEYVGTVTEFYNAEVNGKTAAEAKPLATTDPNTTLTALKSLIASKNLVAGAPSPAADQNAFAVTKAYADKNGLSKTSDLTKLNGQIELGGPPECPQRPFCEIGLQKTYGLKFKGFKPLDAGGTKTIGALKDGSIQLGLVFSSDGAVAANNLVVLDDDKHLQQADNIIYLARNSVPADAQAILAKVNAALTTTDLQGLNKSFSVDKELASDLAQKWVDAHPLS